MARISKREIDDNNRSLVRRHLEFRRAADALTGAWSSVEAVERIALIGSVARPLWKELPRFASYRRVGIELWHECKDLDLAIRLSSLEDLSRLNRLRGQTLKRLYQAEGIGVAHHPGRRVHSGSRQRSLSGPPLHLRHVSERQGGVPGARLRQSPFPAADRGLRLSAGHTGAGSLHRAL